MSYTTLISAEELLPHLDDPDWVIVDSRFSLREVEQGRRSYDAGHIAGAVYAHLDEDLSGPIIPGETGRHPLPTVEEFAATLSGWGIDDAVQVVAFDDSGGAIAARLWWMLYWMGHEKAAVLDGGCANWEAEGLPVRSGPEVREPRSFAPRARPELVLNAEDVASMLNDATRLLCDARGADRFRGENETIDPVAGHIPGAVSVPYADNLDSNGFFLSREDLRSRFHAQLGGSAAENAVMYCGSGVTAAHNVLAIAHAGLGEARLYAGSWSDWITDPARPVSTG